MLMISRQAAGRGKRASDLPRGIIVLDRLPAPRPPQVQAFVWCKHGRKASGMIGNGGEAARPRVAMFMVGLATEDPVD